MHLSESCLRWVGVHLQPGAAGSSPRSLYPEHRRSQRRTYIQMGSSLRRPRPPQVFYCCVASLFPVVSFLPLFGCCFFVSIPISSIASVSSPISLILSLFVCTHTLTITCTCTCCVDLTKGAQDKDSHTHSRFSLFVCVSHTHSLILSLVCFFHLLPLFPLTACLPSASGVS